MSKASAKYPRSMVPLFVVLALAILGYVFLRGDDGDPDFTLGGPVFPLAAEEIQVMVLAKNNIEYKFERFGSYEWSLSGGVSDFLDSRAITDLVSFLAVVKSGSVLPGTAVEDRRYDFDGNESIRLSIFATEGREYHLALGAENPVTGGVYASGAQRKGCFLVGQGLRNKLRALPLTVQEKNLLPLFDTSTLTEINVWRGSEKLTLLPEGSRWWIQEPEDGMAQLGLAFRNYNKAYSDRRIMRDGIAWLLAEPRAVEKLVYESSQVLVRDIIPPAKAPLLMEEWSMQPAWRKITLFGPGINRDPKAGTSDEFTLSYGPPLENDYVPILRQGNLMLADKMAAGTLALPLGQWIDTGAMPFRVEVGDSLRMSKDGQWILSAYPGADEDISRWVGRFPHQEGWSLEERSSQNMIESLIVNLDRLEIVQVLQPSDKAWVLQDSERVQLEFWTAENGASTLKHVEFGWLDLDHLPGVDVARTMKLAEEKDGERPAGMWVPGTGKLLQIPAHLVIQFRNLESLKGS